MPSEVVYKPVEKVKPIYAGGTLSQPKFMPTYFEFLKKHSVEVSEWKVVISSTENTIYTVPANHTLFLVSASLTIVGTAGGTPRTGRIIYRGGTKVLLNVSIMLEGTSDTTSAAFSIPLIINSGDILQVSGANDANTTACITGFLVKNADIPQF